MDKSLKHIGILIYTANCFKNVELKQNANIAINEEFGKHLNDLAHNLIFAMDKETGLMVGTAALWTGKHFGKRLPRLRWIAVHK